MPHRPSLRGWLYRQLFSRAKPYLSPLNVLIIGLIALAVCVTILETEPRIARPYGDFLTSLHWILGGLFVLEFIARLVVIGINPLYAGWRGRLRYLMTFHALVDALALVPFVLFVGADEGFILRLVRLISLVLRLGNFSRTRSFMLRALHSRREELFLCLAVASLVLILAATGLFVLEGAHQPAAFGSIPRALWWALVTLTTVGYGDVVPQTVLGRVIAGLTAVAGIAIIALITSVIASAFSEASHQRRLQTRRVRRRGKSRLP